jgi:hypothetical protein
MQDSDIDDLFARARGAAPEPDMALLQRIAADADAVQAGFRPAPAVATPIRRGPLARWIAALGGGPAVAGLATAALAGVWIGVAQPAPVAALTSGVTAALGQADDTVYVELIPDFVSLGTEG